MKKIYSPEEGQKKLREGIEEFAGSVKSTLGPEGQTVIIKSDRFPGGLHITKDGVTIANEISSPDQVKDLAMSVMKQAARRTAITAGDGTTTSVVLTEAIINKFDKAYNPESDSKIDMIREIKVLKDKVLDQLDQMSLPITPEFITSIASISSNNDPEMGALVADAFEDVDYVSVESTTETETTVTKLTGLRIDKGFTHPSFITDVRKRVCELEDPLILMYDRDIHDFFEFEEMLNEVIALKKSLLIVGTLKPDALASLSVNVNKGAIKACAIEPPSHGFEKIDLMQDITDIIGGTLFNESNGNNARLVTLLDLGVAKKVTVTESMTIIETLDDDSGKVELKMHELKSIQEENTNDRLIEKRIERIANGFSIIKVGSPSGAETKEKKDRMDDAVCAVRSAKEDGVLPGGGKALYTALQLVDHPKSKAFEILESAFMVPLLQMLENAGIVTDAAMITDAVLQNENPHAGYNVKSREYCDLIKSGIMDPTKVTKQALENAVSVATIILSTACVITDHEPSKN